MKSPRPQLPCPDRRESRKKTEIVGAEKRNSTIMQQAHAYEIVAFGKLAAVIRPASTAILPQAFGLEARAADRMGRRGPPTRTPRSPSHAPSTARPLATGRTPPHHMQTTALGVGHDHSHKCGLPTAPPAIALVVHASPTPPHTIADIFRANIQRNTPASSDMRTTARSAGFDEACTGRQQNLTSTSWLDTAL